MYEIRRPRLKLAICTDGRVREIIAPEDRAIWEQQREEIIRRMLQGYAELYKNSHRRGEEPYSSRYF